MKRVAIITAAGQGKRMGRPKQFLKICGQPLLSWTLLAFEKSRLIDEVILVVNAEDMEIARQLKFSKLKKYVSGGEHRQLSVFNGLKNLPGDATIIAIHDGARPLVSPEIIDRAIQEAEKFGAVVVGVPVCDTIKKVDGSDSQIVETFNRELLWAAQTPQVFQREVILKAFEEGGAKYPVTDDAALVEKMGYPVKMVLGSYQNIKITTPEDLIFAEAILKKRS